MEQIQCTFHPEESLTQEEWMKEFKIGRMAPKPDNGRAREMMSMWNGPDKKFFDKLLEGLSLDSIFRS